MQPKTPVIHAASVTKLAVTHGVVTVIFEEMTVTLPTDRVCAVMGRAGSGRTTFLRLLAGTQKPDRGSILTDAKFSIIGNSATFFHGALTGEQNITLSARLFGMDAAVLTEIIMGISRFGDLWQRPAGAVPGPRRRAMEMLVAALLPFDCYLLDDVERADPETLALVLQLLGQRQAGMIFTAQNPKFARQFATAGSVIAHRNVYAYASVEEALGNYA